MPLKKRLIAIVRIILIQFRLGIEAWILSAVQLWWERKTPFLTMSDIDNLGETNWEFNYDDYFFALKPYRREVGFGW